MEDCNCHTKKTTLPSLEGNATAEKALSELTATDFNNENGMKLKLLLKKLDKHGLNPPPPCQLQIGRRGIEISKYWIMGERGLGGENCKWKI